MVSRSGESPQSARKVIVPTWRSRSITIVACSRTLTWAAWMCWSETSSTGLGSIALAARLGELLEPDADQHLGQQGREALLHADLARVPRRLGGEPLLEHAGDQLERAVLHEPGEQQVAGLEQREVLLVLDVALGQQPRRLEVEQGRGDQQERRRLLEVPGLATDLDVRDELVGHPRQRDLGDVELVLGDQAQQQVEGALEVVEAYGEGRRLAVGRVAGARFAAEVSCVVTPRSAAGPGHCRPRGPRSRPAPARSPRARAATVDGESVGAAQHEPRVLDVEQLVGGDVDGHLLVVADPAAGLPGTGVGLGLGLVGDRAHRPGGSAWRPRRSCGTGRRRSACSLGGPSGEHLPGELAVVSRHRWRWRRRT